MASPASATVAEKSVDNPSQGQDETAAILMQLHSQPSVPMSPPQTQSETQTQNAAKRKRTSSSSSSGGEGKITKRRGNLPKATTNLLKAWLYDHHQHPYPTEEEKAELAQRFDLTLNQISNWFINARRRILQPMKDKAKVYLKQTKDGPDSPLSIDPSVVGIPSMSSSPSIANGVAAPLTPITIQGFQYVNNAGTGTPVSNPGGVNLGSSLQMIQNSKGQVFLYQPNTSATVLADTPPTQQAGLIALIANQPHISVSSPTTSTNEGAIMESPSNQPKDIDTSYTPTEKESQTSASVAP